MHLSDKALLVHLGVSQWIAKKLDKKASAEIARANGASREAGRYNKSLLPTCGTLDSIKSKTSEIRKKFYRNTLPWGIEGTFILPSANYLTFMTDFRNERAEWESLTKDFLLGYRQSVMDAKRLLGSLYNASDYPTVGELRKKFRMEMSILPVPSAGDFRVELADDEYGTIQSEIEERVAESSKAAMSEVWQRLYDKVEWLATRLADPKNTFHDATYQDAKDLCGMLTRLNFTDDANLEAMRQEVEQKLVGYHPDALRNDPDLRTDTADEAKVIMDKMSVFMEGLA